MSKLPHTRPYRIYHRVLKSKDILPAPWGCRFRSLIKAVSLLMTCPGPHSISASGLGIGKQNLDPRFVQPPPEYAFLGLGYATKMPYRGGPLYVSSQLRKLGWEKSSSRANGLALFNPTITPSRKIRKSPLHSYSECMFDSGEALPTKKTSCQHAMLDGLRSESRVIG